MSDDATLDEFAESASKKSSEDNRRTHSLGDLAEYQNGNAFSKSEWANNGYPIIRIQNLTGEQDEFNYYDGDLEERYKVQSGDTLLSWSATIDVFQWRGSDAALNQHIFRVDTSESVNDTFYRFKLESLLPQLEALSHGSTMKHVRKADLVNLDTEIPPLSEQRKIATVLHTVDQAIQKTEEITEMIKRVKTGVMKSVYTQGINNHNLVDTDFGKMPESWELIKIENMCDIGGGGTPSRDNDQYWGGSILWTTPKDFDSPRMLDTKEKLTDEGANEVTSDVYDSGGTILVVRSGILRRKLPVAKIVTPTTVNQDLKVLEPNGDIIDSDYLFQIIHSRSEQIRGRCKKVGTTVESIETSMLQKYRIKVPPLSEQKKIAEIGEDFDRQIQSNQKIADQLRNLKHGLMQDLLSGEVRATDVDIDIPEEVAKYG